MVVGAGVAGAAAAWALARERRDVLLVERFRLGHAHGSSHGTSRIFRLAYPDAAYVRLAREALGGWRELEAEAGEELIAQTGALDVGAHAQANREALATCGIATEWLDAREVASRWPFRLPAGTVALFQQDGGIVRADRALAAFVAGARASGASIDEGRRVTAVVSGRTGVRVTTDRGEIEGRVAVVTAGSWARRLLADAGIDLPVTVTRETVVYAELDDERPPSLIQQTTTGEFPYALWAPGAGVKAGFHMSGREADPDEAGAPDPVLVERTAAWLAERVPAASVDEAAAQTCLYTTTPDERFVLERRGRVVIGSACSGHGFKFGPVVGKRLAELAREALSGP